MSGEFEVGGVAYRSRRIPAIEQWALLRRLMPVLPGIAGADLGLRQPGLNALDITTVMLRLGQSSEEDMVSVIGTVRAMCERRTDDGWEPLPAQIGFGTLVAVVMAVAARNFGALFAMDRPSFTRVAAGGAVYEPVAMPGGEDWIFRPVLRGLCRAESLYDGTLQIEHIAKLNDALAVEEENQARARQAAERR